MKPVTKEKFYEAIGDKDVVLSTTTGFPFTTEFKLRGGKLVGKSIDRVSMEPNEDYVVTDYFLATEI